MGRELSGVEVVAIGDELLSGATLDSNAATIARRLETLGLRVVRKTTVGDVAAQISEAVRSALAGHRAAERAARDAAAERLRTDVPMLLRSQDAREGISAMVERRTPEFQGA